MNRTIGVVIVLLVILGLAIYINAQRKDETSTAWQDGTYFGRSEPDQRDGSAKLRLPSKTGK